MYIAKSVCSRMAHSGGESLALYNKNKYLAQPQQNSKSGTAPPQRKTPTFY